MIPVFGNDWKSWARQLTTALKAMPLQLRAKNGDESAAEDGVLVWDRSLQQVQVSKSGAYVAVGGATDLTYTASTRVIASSTGADATLPLVTSGDAGLAPASGGGTSNFLRADATWAVPSNVPDGDKGDITVTASGATWTIDNNAISDAKLRDSNAYSVIGRETGTIGDPADIIASSVNTVLVRPFSGTLQFNTIKTDYIDNDQVTNAKMANMAEATIKGRAVGAGTGDPTDLTATQATAVIASSSTGSTGNFLRADGTWASAMTVTLGPFYINDLPGTATTQATLGYFDSATTVSRNTNDIRVNRAGRVVGMMIVSDDARTAGTATAQVRIEGTGTAFDGGSVQLGAVRTTTDSSFVAYTDGVSFAANDRIGAEVVTSGWTPTTANLLVYVVVMFEPF